MTYIVPNEQYARPGNDHQLLLAGGMVTDRVCESAHWVDRREVTSAVLTNLRGTVDS